MAVSPRRKIPEAIFLVVKGNETYLYHSFLHAWNRKTPSDKLYKISTARMEEIIT
jgi:hypothetical protein